MNVPERTSAYTIACRSSCFWLALTWNVVFLLFPREIHSSDSIALVRPVEEAVSDCQVVAFAYLSIYPPKKVGTALWIGKILDERSRTHLGVYDRLPVILLLAGADLECGLLALS